jgi:DNA polymerase-1
MFKVIEEPGRVWLRAVDFKLCQSLDQLRTYLSPESTKTALYVGADQEWSDENIEKAEPVGLSFSNSDNSALYVPVGHKVGEELNLPLSDVYQILWDFDSRPDGVPSVWWHYGGDSEFLLRQFKRELARWEDAMLSVYLENPNHKEYGLKACGTRMLQVDVIEFKEVTGGKTFDLVHPTDAVDYGCQDAWLARRLHLLPSVQNAIKEQDFVYRLEKQVCPVKRDGEMNKVYLDQERLLELKADVERKVGPLLGRIYDLAGGEFKVDSPAVLGPKLVSLGVPITEKTGKTQQPQTKKEILEKYKSYHPVIELIIQYKVLTTQMRNYVAKMIGAVENFGPLVRFPFHQVGVPTGRMKAGGEGGQTDAYSKGVVPVNIQSLPDHEKAPYLPNIRSAVCANPPLQNMTPGTEEGERIVRRFADDFVIIAVDYSQVELRIAANMSREPAWIKTFSEGGDIHHTNAKLAYRDYQMRASDPRRKRGKTMSFAILYGGSEYTVAQHGGITVEQGKLLVDNFFAGAPQLKRWIDSWTNMARQQKFVKTTFGRKRPLDEYYAHDAPRWLKLKGDREAVNDPIQGGAADIFKIGMVKLEKMIHAKNWRHDLLQTLWIHDEFVLRARRSMAEEMVPEIVKALEFEVKGWPVKLKVDVEVGWNWGEMIPWKAYQVLGEQGLDLKPWASYEEAFREHGANLISHLTEIEAKLEEDEMTDPSFAARSAYGF